MKAKALFIILISNIFFFTGCSNKIFMPYEEEPFNLPEIDKKGCHMILVSPETFNETIKIANDLKKNKMVDSKRIVIMEFGQRSPECMG